MDFLGVLQLIITIVFFLSVSFYYVLFLIPVKKEKTVENYKSISIIMPAHNEEKYIETTLKYTVDADFNGVKEIIVIDDGSIDNTSAIVKNFIAKNTKNKKIKITLLHANHIGKSASINKALKIAKGELVAIVDADSYIQKDSLMILKEEVSKENVAAATGIVKVFNRKKFLCIWPQIELLYNSLIRSLIAKMNANVVTPGALSMYRTSALRQIGGFSTQGFCEDTDIAIRLIRKGYRVGYNEKAVSETNMPDDLKGFARQRFRSARGLIDILKRHMKLNTAMIDLYTLPLILFSYFQAVIMGSIMVYNMVSGYFTYFVSKGIYFNWYVVKFFFDWFSIVGFINWMINVFSGASPLTMLAVVGISATLLSYPLYFISIFKYEKKIDFYHLFAICFMSPYWLVLMCFSIVSLPEYFRKKQYNRWKKNEK